MEPDEETMLRFVALLPEPRNATFFSQLKKVEPGTILTIRKSGETLWRYWKAPRRVTRFPRPRDYEEALVEQLDAAVLPRLRRVSGPISTQLSGGLDSSSVTASAARLLALSGETLDAFTAVPRLGYDEPVPPGTFADERYLATQTASLYPNIRHKLVSANDHTPLSALERAFQIYQRPLLNPENFVWIHKIRDIAAARGSRVMLTASLGNMSLSYHGLEALPQLLAEGKLLRFASLSSGLLSSGFPLRSIVARAVGPFVPRYLWKQIRRARGKAAAVPDYAALTTAALGRLEPHRRRGELDGSYRPSASSLDARLSVIGRMDPGSYQKGALGGWGIEIRDPTADRRLVEFCLSLPADLFIEDGRPRSLVRRAMRGRVPAEVLDEKRKGYQAADWHEQLAQELGSVHKLLDQIEGSLAGKNLLDIGRLRALVSHWPSSGWGEDRVRLQYRSALLRGLSAGAFLAQLDEQRRARVL
jgi:asparagine synthase (glutamine-hydrolysing)